MRLISVATSATALCLTGSVLLGQGSPALDAAAAAMGGKDHVLAVRTLILEGRGENLNFGQNYTPDADTKFEVTSFKRSIDVANGRWFLDQTREPRFVTANTAPQRQRLGFDSYLGGGAYNVGNDGTMSRAAAQTTADRANELLYYPVAFIAAAYRPTTQVSEESGGANMRKVNIDAGGNKVAMLVDTRTNLPARIEKVVYNPMLGDVTIATEFSDWRDASGVNLPTRMVQRLANRWTLSDYRVAGTRVNEDVGNVGMTDSVRALTPLLAPAVTVAVEELAPGVWWIGGGTHHTIAIEQSRSIVLVESPQNDERALAAIAKARELRPGKPVEIVINTHHHFDHAGGVRAAISQGLTIVTHEANKDFYERAVFPGRHSSQPDALAKSRKPLKLIPVHDKRIMSDGLRTIEIYEATGNPHAGTMLVVYLPAEKILIQADMYNPPAANVPPPPGFPFVANLLDNVKRRGLVVERVVGIHGRPVPLSELQAAASRAP
jgi:glyoxylase-like metal-dependent hydrolase (beta-lactamase superfamily II)